MSRMDAFREEFDKMGRDEDYERQVMNYGDREKSALPDSPIEPYIADWKERRKYALLQAAAVIYAANVRSRTDSYGDIQAETYIAFAESSVKQAQALLSKIESRLPESAE